MKNDRSGYGNQSESEANSQYMEMTKTKVEAIRQALMRFDKDLDDQISKDELLDFLDSNMKNGQKFDRGLANKIFEALDIDQNGKITCEEFIRNFISIEEEIKAHAKELQGKYYAEKENNNNLNRLLMENKNEKLNDQGISNMSKVTIEIANIEFLTPIVGIQERISIRLKYEGQEKETRVLSGDDNLVVWKEKFEYKVNRRDILYFEVLNTDQFGQKEVIGAVKFPLDRIEKQEEYDLELEIPDENDDRIIMAKINAKIRFVWSTYKLYQDQLNKSERLLQNYNNMLQKTNKLLENLNEPMKYFQAIEDKYDSHGDEPSFDANKIKLKGKKHTDNVGTPVDHTKQYEVADKLENLLKSTLSKDLPSLIFLDKPNIQWMWLIKIFIFADVILGYINTFQRSDFLNIIIPTVILVIFYTTLNKNVVRNLHFFLLAIAGNVIHDLLWILFSSGSYASGLEGGMESSLRSCVFITSISSFIVKILLGFSIWIQKLKYEREQASDNSAAANLV